MRIKAGKTGMLVLIIALGSFALYGSSTIWHSDYLNTAVNASYLSAFEKEVVLEINKLRSDPARYAREYIEPLKGHYNGRKFYYPGDLPLMTKEGVRALIECSEFLKNHGPAPILKPDQGLSQAADDHVTDQSKTGYIGHKGRDHSGFRDRIERYGEWAVRIAENIAYGNVTPRQVVIYLLIDDGMPSRGHRKNFLNEDFRLIGVAEGSHPGYERMCVMEFAGKFQNLASK